MASWVRRLSLAAVVGVLGAGCSHSHGDDAQSGEDNFSSDVASLVDMSFDGVLVTASGANPKGNIKAQLLYTVGQLNGENGVSQMSKLQLTNVVTKTLGGGLYQVSYHAKLPVAWGSKTNIPKTYSLSLPKRVDQAGQDAFTKAYGQSCNDGEGDSVLVSNFWFHYRPKAQGCVLKAADVTAVQATLQLSPKNTSNKYPEYQKVWEDGSLNVLAVFGKYEEGAKGDDDAGIAAYNAFVGAVRDALPNAAAAPGAAPYAPGAAYPDVTIEATLDDGRRVTVSALLVDRVSNAPPSFDARYAELSAGADLLIYDGHAGLGTNVAALSKKGKYFPGKYQILFLNGCDTFAYADDTLAVTRSSLNPDDPGGTKYLDVMANALPAYFSSMPDASMALVRAMTSAPASPTAYNDIFKGIDTAQVVVVTGEEDNVFTPSYDPGARWAGLEESGTVGYKEAKAYETDVLSPGKYVSQMTPEASAPGGDGDLRVRVGQAPTPDKTYKCPSYVANSNERCVITVSSPSKIYFTATGDKQSQASSYIVRAFQQLP